jgi:prephenate dehydrogenase
MAGRESSGPRAASPALFRGATWVVVEGSSVEATDRAVHVIETLGANPLLLSGSAHDDAVATISHLPQVLAAGLLASAAETPEALDLAAGSFRDLTRVAASQPIPWVEILKSNEAAVLSAIDELRRQLDKIESAIRSDDDDLLSYLSHARDVRHALGAPVVAVRVSLADEPGELARVGHALENSHVDVRDIQMRHAPYGGGGVLTLSVRAGEEEALRHALEAAGLLTVS